MSARRHVLVLGDQLNRDVGPLAGSPPEATSVLMIESLAIADALPHHRQKLTLVISAMRHFAEGLRSSGFPVTYLTSDDFRAGIAEYLSANPGATLQVMRPTDHGVEEELVQAAEDAGGTMEVVPNELWLTSEEEFDTWAAGRKSLRLEYFYRTVRESRGWLMQNGEPIGGTWNHDADNRRTPEAGHRFPPVRTFEPDPTTSEVRSEIARRWPDHFGLDEGFGWPVTREHALAALDDFLKHRLRCFGPFEDAMVAGEDTLYHSLLSVSLNLGLLHPSEVCERALAYAADPDHDVPINSIEGFIRQILGWREFVRHIYRRSMPRLRTDNGLEAHRPLPGFYWDGRTRMRCLSTCVDQVRRTGHAHHIQRLMVLGNFALLAGVDPREVNDWFLATFVDALDWVVTPNVMGMSQFADLGSFTTKPYAASGKYINRMSDYCGDCPYDVASVESGDACPFNSLYWSFIDRHLDRWQANHRMALVAGGWKKREPGARRQILDRAGQVLDLLSEGEL